VQIEGFCIQRNFLMAYSAGLKPQGVAQEFRRFLLSRANMPGTRTAQRLPDKKSK
jgi:hypothetical protein